METIGARVLVVDDEPALRKMVSAYLGRLGYRVETCGSSETARARIENEPGGFALAVLDGTLPGLAMNDLVLGMLRTSPDLRVIVASGYPVDMTGMEAAAGDRVAFLPKPFAPEMLASLARRMLGAQEEDL
ncbi:MAG: response regulator [Bryobacteraceae bacterium]|jgi:DNA-binding NtrC family response regulator